MGASKDVLLIVYKALIRSVLDYGCMAYDTASKNSKGKADHHSGQMTENLLRSSHRYVDIGATSRMRTAATRAAQTTYASNIYSKDGRSQGPPNIADRSGLLAAPLWKLLSGK